jgi:type I restriction enzyme S subunit
MATESKHTKPFYKTEIPSNWATPEFGDVFNFLKTFSFSRAQLTSEPTNDGIRNIHYGDIHATYENEILDLNIEKTVPYLLDGLIDPKSFDDEFFPGLKEGDLIIADASEDYEGVCNCVELKNINGVKVVSGLHTFAARTSKEKVALGYRTYALQHEQVIRELRRIATGTSVYGVSKTNLSKVKIPLPPLPEQKAIAQVLSTADAAIHTTEKLIAQKELRKKWLMQNLLTGRLRLRSASSEYFGGEWKEVHIRDVAKEVSIRNKSDKQLTVLSCTKYDGLVPSLEYFGRKIFADNVTTYKIVPKNHFAYATNHIEEGSIGYQEILDEALISPMYTVFRTDKTVNDNFFYKLLKSHPMVYQYQNRMEGSIDRRGGLRWDGFSIIKIKLPSYEEQTAIARVLQAADKEIGLLKAKAEKLREQKKGMMQVLLTGKVRLKIN